MLFYVHLFNYIHIYKQPHVVNHLAFVPTRKTSISSGLLRGSVELVDQIFTRINYGYLWGHSAIIDSTSGHYISIVL